MTKLIKGTDNEQLTAVKSATADDDGSCKCHIGYAKEEKIVTDCSLTLREKGRLLQNYELLNDTDMERVTNDSYTCVKEKYSTQDPTEGTEEKKE